MSEQPNPYRSPKGEAPPPPRRAAKSLFAVLLLPVPFLLCGATLYLSTFFGIGLIHLSLISILPLSFGIVSGNAISRFLLPSPWYRILAVAYGIAIFLMWGWCVDTFHLNPFP